MRAVERPIRVLLCDDHVAARQGLRQLLSAFTDVQVVGEAEDGAEAVGQAHRLEPDVVLMDLSMPNLGGLEATRRMVAELPGIRVLVLTSSIEGERVRAAIDAGAAGYLLKDSAVEELVQAIASVAVGESPIDPRAARAFLEYTRQASAEAKLKPREREVLGLIGAGLSNRAIAARLGISDATVKAHVTQIYRQLGVADRSAAVAWAKANSFKAR